MGEDFPAQLTWFRQGSMLAGYRLESQVGVGGMAVVFRAHDERLSRPVALKILAPTLAADGAFRRRFIAESRAAAAVDDPHIIPIYEAGEADGALFIAMRFVQGGDLRRVLEREGALPPDRAAAFISPVASALDAAHGAGLVHRDVKPANILVDARPDRPDHVYLSDFGVSKGAISSVSLTGAGHFLGTPDYSAPEQIQGRVVDGRTDQYALACVAYQLLTGTVPFQRDQGMAVLLAHLSEAPPPLGSRRPDLPAAPDEVLGRALAKTPEMRYASCGDFANALREALGLTSYHTRRSAATTDRPQTAITSQPEFPGPNGPGNASIPADLSDADTIDSMPGGGSPGIAGLSAAAAIVAGRVDLGARPQAAPPVITEVAREEPLTAAATFSRSSVANVRTASQRPPSIPGSHREARPARRRGRLLATVLAGAVVAAAAIVVPLLAGSHGSASSPGSPSSASPESSPPVVAAGKLAAILTDPDSSGVTSVAFGPSGATLATTDSNGSTYLWKVPGGKLAATLTDPGSPVSVTSAVFSPSGATLATTSNHDGTLLWHVPGGKQAATLTDPGGLGVTSAAFGPSGATLATTDSNGSTYLWNVATRKLTATLTDPGSLGVTSAAFGPSGATLATTDTNGSTYLWNVATRKLTATLTDPGSSGVTSVAFSPSGATLATTDSIGNTYLWHLATRKLIATLTDPGTAGVTSVAFSPSGATLATSDNNGNTYLWKTATRKLIATFTVPRRGGVNSVAFSPSGATLATTDNNGNTYLWIIR